MALLRRALRWLAAWTVGLLIVFEEWGWEPLQRALAELARLPLIGWIERRIAALPPYGALALFLVPSLSLLPIKLLALWLIGHGHSLLGLGVIVVAKVAGTAVVARLFSLTHATLMRLPWFARLYQRWTAWKDGLLEQVRQTWPWRASRVFKRVLQRRFARWRSG